MLMTDPATFLTVAIVVVAGLLLWTITGRYILRRIVVTLALVAGAAIFLLDGRSPLG